MLAGIDRNDDRVLEGDILTIVGVALLRAGRNPDGAVTVVLCSWRADQLIFVNNEPVRPVSSGEHDLVIVPSGPGEAPGLAVVSRVAVSWLGALQTVVCGVPGGPLGHVSHPVPLVHTRPRGSSYVCRSVGAGLETAGAWDLQNGLQSFSLLSYRRIGPSPRSQLL